MHLMRFAPRITGFDFDRYRSDTPGSSTPHILSKRAVFFVLQVKDLFLPSNNDLHHKFVHGYVVHQDQKDLYKVDLEAMKYVKTIDLGNYDCVPHSVSFVPLGELGVSVCVYMVCIPQGQHNQGCVVAEKETLPTSIVAPVLHKTSKSKRTQFSASRPEENGFRVMRC